MRLPISTASMTFMSVSAPQPVTDFETKQPRSDENGVPLYNAQVVALSDGEAEIMAIKVAWRPWALRARHGSQGDRAYRPAVDDGGSLGNLLSC